MRKLGPQRLDVLPVILWRERFKSRILSKLILFITPSFLLSTKNFDGPWKAAELNNTQCHSLRSAWINRTSGTDICRVLENSVEVLIQSEVCSECHGSQVGRGSQGWGDCLGAFGFLGVYYLWSGDEMPIIR